MSKCKFRRFERVNDYNMDLVIKDFMCNEVRKLLPEWKKKWKKENGDIPNDKYFDQYFNDIEDYLSKCKCEKAEDVKTI